MNTGTTTKSESVQRVKYGCGQVHVEDCRYNHPLTPMACAGCGKALRLELLTHAHARHYFCPEHCPSHKWASTPHWPSPCQHCGIDELTFRRAEVETMREQIDKLQERLLIQGGC